MAKNLKRFLSNKISSKSKSLDSDGQFTEIVGVDYNTRRPVDPNNKSDEPGNEFTKIKGMLIDKLLTEEGYVVEDIFIDMIINCKDHQGSKFSVVDEKTIILFIAGMNETKREAMKTYASSILERGLNLLLPLSKRNPKLSIFIDEENNLPPDWRDVKAFISIIMVMMGYEKMVDNIMHFPRPKGVNKLKVAELVLDMAILKHEIEKYANKVGARPPHSEKLSRDFSKSFGFGDNMSAKLGRVDHPQMRPSVQRAESISDPYSQWASGSSAVVKTKIITTNTQRVALIASEGQETAQQHTSSNSSQRPEKCESVQANSTVLPSMKPMHESNPNMLGWFGPPMSPPVTLHDDDRSKWHCERCNYDNFLLDTICLKCSKLKPLPLGDSSAVVNKSGYSTPTSPAVPMSPKAIWTCKNCYHENGAEGKFCCICGRAETDITSPTVTPCKQLDTLLLPISQPMAELTVKNPGNGCELDSVPPKPTWLCEACNTKNDIQTKVCAICSRGESAVLKIDKVENPLSVPKTKKEEFQERAREILARGKVSSYEKAEMVATLLGLNYNEDDVLEAVKQCNCLDTAITFLQHDCEICMEVFPISKMVAMLNCNHQCCVNCAKNHFTEQIKGKGIKDLICPFCNEPSDLDNQEVANTYFDRLDLMLRDILSKEIYELFHRKMRDKTLKEIPNFQWCTKCESGYDRPPMEAAGRQHQVCPNCKEVTCARCKEMWDSNHYGISCEEFAEKKKKMQPKEQVNAGEKLLEDEIVCPKCQMKYSLARGGCMHFKCTSCKHEFCSGCGQQFLRGDHGDENDRCVNKGFHAHHPRNCLNYLRDKEPEELQMLLTNNKCFFETNSKSNNTTCLVEVQKEVDAGLKDGNCGEQVTENNAGLCKKHYTEYLGMLIFRNNISVTPPV